MRAVSYTHLDVYKRQVTDKTGLKSHLEYDKNDNLTKVTDALGGVTTYGYDNMDKDVYKRQE